MLFIDTPDPVTAAPETARLYAAHTSGGYLPNMYRAFGHGPEVLAAWENLLGAIKARMDLRRYELVTIAAAKALTSSYCLLAHGKVLLGGHFSAEELAGIVADPERSVLSPAEKAIMGFAARVARDATSITAGDVDALKSHGLSDAEVFDVVTAAAVRCFFSKTLDALGARPDAVYAELPDVVRPLLAVGRPIDTAPY